MRHSAIVAGYCAEFDRYVVQVVYVRTSLRVSYWELYYIYIYKEIRWWW